MCSLQEHIERDVQAQAAAKATQEPDVPREERERTAYWGTCDDCLTTIVVYPHPDRDTDLPDDEEWEGGWPDCPVCDSSLDWEGTDPASHIIRNYA
ncbi:hypothetical protein QEO74_gp12 [Arthrobacter phage Nandita]|uniref:Uncharacterized protein n=1 Tax=Arthrobacter phage Nandita TaxID=2419963 RepID=A0A3G2KI72_9CAUD|nr:hypothetical protein QEO74_gp12 [Arthrobacter phage Nandita]AYN58678.1 hypothetical protein PBI_NANDITA_59 [Arthrobacter phage Nandita]